MSDADHPTLIQPDPNVGRTLGRCTLERKLGEGGMGAVYLAHHGALDIKVAVKLLPEGLAQLESWRKRFVREARIAARLDHPNAVRVMDVESEGTPYLVMELVRGKSLGSALKQHGAIPWRDAVRMARQAAEALAAAHALDLVHRDIKPDNLMLTDGGVVKVADFGLARNVTEKSDLTMAGAIQGSPDYLAPEQGGGMQVDGRADVYSLAVTLHALLTGAPTYRRDSAITTITANFTEPLPLLGPGFPPDLDALLAEMTVKHPNERRVTMAAVVKRLAAIEASGGRRAAARATKAMPTRGATAWIGGGAIAVAVVVVLAVGIGRNEPTEPSVKAAATTPLAKSPIGNATGSGTAPGSQASSKGLDSGGSGAATAPGSGSPAGEPTALVGQGSSASLPPANAAFAEVERTLVGLSPDRQVALLDRYLDGLEDGLDRRSATARRDAAQRDWALAEGQLAADAVADLMREHKYDEASARLAERTNVAPEGLDSVAWDPVVRRLRAELVAAAGRLLDQCAAELERQLALGDLAGARAAFARVQTVDDPDLGVRAADLSAALDRAVAAQAMSSSAADVAAAYEARLAAAHSVLAKGDLAAALAAVSELRGIPGHDAALSRTPADLRWVELDALDRCAKAYVAAISPLVGKATTVELETGETMVAKLERAVPEVAFATGALELVIGKEPPKRGIASWAQRARWAEPRLGVEGAFALFVTLHHAGATMDAGPWLVRARAANDATAARWLAERGLAAVVPIPWLVSPVPVPHTFKLRSTSVPAEVYLGAWQGLWKTAVTGALDALATDPEGRWVAGAGEQGVIHTLRLSDGVVVLSSEERGRPLRTLAYHARTRQLVGSDPNHYVLAAWDNKRWNQRLVDSGSGALGVAYSPDGAWCAIGCADARIYDTDTWKAPRILGNARVVGESTAVCWHPSGQLLAVSHAKDSDGRVHLYRPTDGELIRSMDAAYRPHRLAFGDKGRLLAAGCERGDVLVWETATGKAVFEHRVATDAAKTQRTTVAFSPDGRLLAWASGSELSIWETGAWTRLKRVAAHEAPITDLAFVGDRLVTIGTEGTFRCWGLPK